MSLFAGVIKNDAGVAGVVVLHKYTSCDVPVVLTFVSFPGEPAPLEIFIPEFNPKAFPDFLAT